ncbi:MAG: zinc-ribbon and DUF3426 domain-containing protein [Aquisalimonadaceae bacterium]
MYSQCPACATLFRVGEALPDDEGLRVRCGMCAQIFDPRLRFAETLPKPFLAYVRVPEDVPEQQPELRLTAPSDAAAASADTLLATEDETADEQSLAPDSDWHLASALEVELRSKLAQYGPVRGTGVWVAGVLALVVLLVGQVFWFQRHDLAEYPQLRPWLERMCAVGRCTLPMQRAPDLIRLMRGQVTDHPETEGALMASATLVNTAGFRQPYPLLKLSLLDEDQNVVGERWFHPDDYLDDPVQRQEWQRGIPSQHAVAVRIALQDPGSGSAQYVFTMER